MADSYVNATGVQTIKTWIEGKFALDADLDTLSDRVDDIISEGGEPNTIDTISVNGTNVPPDGNKNVALTVPTKTSDLTNDGNGTSNFATEAYVGTHGGKIDTIKVNGTTQTITNKTVDITVPTKTSDITNDSHFAVDASYVHTDNNFTTTLKTKLNGIATGAEVNQNAFSTVMVGTTSIQADAKTDTLMLAAGDNITLTPDAANDNITIAATDTTYSNATTSAAGLMSSADKTKLNGIDTGAEVNQNAFSTVKVGTTNVQADTTTDTLTLTAGDNITLTPDATNDSITIAATDTTYSNATTSVAGLMSSGDKTKLNGIATGAEVNVQANWNETSSSSDAYIKNKPTIPSAVSQLTNDSGYQTASDVSTAISAAVSSAYIYKGSVATVSDLPASGNTTGDVYDVQATGVNYAWNGTAWDALGSYVDTTLYWAKTELTAMTTTEINNILNGS